MGRRALLGLILFASFLSSYANESYSCGATVILMRAAGPPTLQDYDVKRELPSTGNVTAPQNLVLGPVSSNALATGNRIYMGIDFEEPSCVFYLTLLNSSWLQTHASAHEVKNVSFKITREEDRLVVQAPVISNVVQYRLFWTPFSAETGWCDLNPLTSWVTERVIVVQNASSRVDLAVDTVFAVRVRFNDGSESELRRVFFDAPPAQNAVRILSNILIPVMVIFPLIILFGGYHKNFGKRFLMFQYVSVFDEQHQPADVTLKKASLHSFVLIGIQAVFQICVVAIAVAVEQYLSLHLPIAVFSIPILLLGAIATSRKEPNYILGYIVLQVWFVAMQVSAMLILVNIGSDAINDTGVHRAAIFTQLLIAADVIVVIVSLSPITFLYMKTASNRFVKTYESDPSESQDAKLVLGLTFGAMALTLAWMGVNLFFLPHLSLRIELVMHFFIEMHLTIASSLLSLFGIFAVLYNHQLYASISLGVQLVSIPIVLGFTTVDIFNSERYDDLNQAVIARVVVYLCRIAAFCCQAGAAFFLLRVFPRLSEERLSWWQSVKSELHPLQALVPRIGRANLAVLISSCVLFIACMLTIVFRISGEIEFPQAYIMFYLLVLGQPAALVGAFTDTALLLVLTIALDLTPLLMWISFTSYGAGYWVVFLFEVARLAFVLWAMVGAGIRHWKRQTASPEERGLATTEFVAEVEDGDHFPESFDPLHTSPEKRAALLHMEDAGDEELEIEATVSDDHDDLLQDLDEDSDRI